MSRFSSNASRTALVGVLSAGCLAFMWLACLMPTGRLGLNAVSGLFPMIAVMAGGRTAGYCCWAAAAILALILMPDKGVAVLFLLFFGIYPVLKSLFELQNRQFICWGLKFGFFNLVLVMCWVLLRNLFLTQLPAWLSKNWLILLLGNAVFLIYDIGLTRLIFGLLSRLNMKKHKF